MKRMVSLFVMFCGITLAGEAAAGCYWSYWRPNSSYAITVPAELTMRPNAGLGEVLARYRTPLFATGLFAYCGNGDVIDMTLDLNGLALSGYSHVYETGVEGIGIRISYYAGGGPPEVPPPSVYLPLSRTFDDHGNFGTWAPEVFYVEYIRTGMAVGSGTVPAAFTARWVMPLASGQPGPSTIAYTSMGTTKLINSSYFTTCESLNPHLEVPMGKGVIRQISNGASPVVTFGFDVSCRGWKPTLPPPVKIYFQGDSPGPGLLRLSGAGQPGVARGVGIALTNGQNVNLPFIKANAIALQWQRSETGGEIYRFDGRARYTSLGGEYQPGSADAALTYVFEYN